MKANFEAMLDKAIKDKNEFINKLPNDNILITQAKQRVSKEDFALYCKQQRKGNHSMFSREALIESGLTEEKYLLCIKFYTVLGEHYALGRDYLGRWRKV